MEIVVALALLAAVLWIVATPLRPGRAAAVEAADAGRRAELEAARDAKYREIRDTELDHRTGKLSEADWRVADRTLRQEAVAILRELDALGEPEPPLP
jgi:hypothetical protein